MKRIYMKAGRAFVAFSLSTILILDATYVPYALAADDAVRAQELAVKLQSSMTAIEDSDIFEVSTPELHDVVRLEDRYGREDKK